MNGLQETRRNTEKKKIQWKSGQWWLVQLLSHVWFFETPRTTAYHPSLSFTIPEFAQAHVHWVRSLWVYLGWAGDCRGVFHHSWVNKNLLMVCFKGRCWERLKAKGEGGSRGWMVGWHHWLNGHESEQMLGDSEDREAWRAAVHGVSKSWTWLSDWTGRQMGNRLLCALPVIFSLSHFRNSLQRNLLVSPCPLNARHVSAIQRRQLLFLPFMSQSKYNLLAILMDPMVRHPFFLDRCSEQNILREMHTQWEIYLCKRDLVISK